jgi:hypothetical protein
MWFSVLLKDKINFIRFFYETAITPFEEIKQLIENQEEPYIPKTIRYDDEPEFLKEWSDADAGLDITSHACISMLSSTLHLILKKWFEILIKQHQMDIDFNFKKNGWFKEYLRQLIEIGFSKSNCLADLEILEQIILARNRVQHPDDLISIQVSHSDNDLKKYPCPFFISDGYWFRPMVAASKNKIEEAILNVEAFSEWLESEYYRINNS